VRRRRGGAVEADFWPGFTDVLSGMLLAMVFVLTLFAVTQTGLVHMVGGKDAQLRALEEQAAELRALLSVTEEQASMLRSELLGATEAVETLGAAREADQGMLDSVESDLAAERSQIAVLTRRLKQYLSEVKDLNAKLVGAEVVAQNSGAKLADLQVAINRLRGQLALMSGQLGTAQQQASQRQVRVSELLVEMARKDLRIENLERLERYRSEFLERMSEVFADNPNVKVVGDRFVFQSEVLFASGSADIGQSGRLELDKFVGGFRALIPRIPKDLAVNVQVQGHTDSDRIVSNESYTDNWELSTARALQVVEYLASKNVPEAMLSAAGFGEHFPRVRGDSTEAKAQNRRIEIRITQR
jgi:chemotaxis protein MotB